MSKKRNFILSQHSATKFAILGVIFIEMTFGSAMAQPCPGKSFESFFDALLEKGELQREFSYNPIVYRAYGAPVDAELLEFDKLPMNKSGRILPKKQAGISEYKVKLYDKYIDVTLYVGQTKNAAYLFTYEKAGSCWNLTTIQEYE